MVNEPGPLSLVLLALIGLGLAGCDRCGPAVEVRAAPLSIGGLFGCYADEGGGVRCWGQNRDGQLGDGGEISRATPAPVEGLSGVVALSAGGRHACAIDRRGRLWCWGGNLQGQLGDGTTSDRNRPSRVAGLPPVIDVSAGGDHTCAVGDDGRVRCWGCNTSGQIGNGHSALVDFPGKQLSIDEVRDLNEERPVEVPGLEGVVDVAVGSGSAGLGHSCALDGQGRVRCWGESRFGALGDGSPPCRQLPCSRARPAPVAGLPPAAAVAAGGVFTCALLRDGRVACWGALDGEEDPNDPHSQRRSPQIVAGVDDAVAIEAGHRHLCALRRGGGVLCWGRNDVGQLGSGDRDPRSEPVAVVELPSARHLSAGDRTTCAVTTGAGWLFCWGFVGEALQLLPARFALEPEVRGSPR